MSLNDQIISDAALKLDLVSGFGVEIIHWPAGDSGAAVTIPAAVFFDNQAESSTNFPGGRDSVATEEGRHARSTGMLEIADSVSITIGAGPGKKSSKFIIDGVRYTAERVWESDPGLQAVRIARSDKIQRKRTVVNP